MLQLRTSLDAGQTTPPCFAACVIVRVRTCTPVPHDLLHTLHSCTVNAQSCGHAWRLQDSTCNSVPVHGFPPLVCRVFTARARVFEPPPHVWVQEPHCAYSSHSQSVGHECTLHMRESTISGQIAPPSAAVTRTVRLRICKPLPQDTEHSSQMPNALTVQSMGQFGPLQVRELVSEGQALPPYLADLLTTRS